MVDTTNQDRSEQIKIATYGREVWAMAQQKVSKYKMHTVMKQLDGGNFKLFSKNTKREYSEKAGGMQDSPVSQLGKSRRALFTKSYHVGLAVDKDDLVDNQFDLESTARMEDENAAARLCDRVILDAQIGAVYESTDSDSSLRGGGQITATIDLEKKYRANVWAKAGGANNSPIAALTADDLEDISFVFAQRDVEERLVCTLTPELRRILRKDADFKNRENTYQRDMVNTSPHSGIEYKDILFVPCSREVLPLLGTRNIGLANAANKEAAVDVIARDFQATDPSDVANHRAGLGSGLINTPAKLKAATDIEGETLGGKAAVVTTKSSGMIYFWVPAALFFAKRDSLNFTRKAELHDQSFANYAYSRVNFGATLIDDDFSMAVALTGRVKTAAA